MRVTRYTPIGDIRVVYRILGYQRPEHVAVDISGYRTLDNPRHMASDAVGKGVDGMGAGFIDEHMAFKALLRSR